MQQVLSFRKIKIMSSMNVDDVTTLVSVTENYWAIRDAKWIY